jgi:AcrR family transcriptional regulator
MTKTDTDGRTRPAAADRAAEIFLTAAEIIAKKGFDATTMNDIAAAVDLTKAGLYYYAKSKRDLLYMIISLAMDEVEQKVIRICRLIDDPEQRLRTIIRNHIMLVVESGESVTILTEEVDCLSPAHRRKIIKRKRDYLEVVTATLEELRRAGRLRNLDTTVAAHNLFATILGTARWYRRGGKLSPKQIAQEVTEFILGGVISV